MKMAIDEIIVRPGRRKTAAHDVRELAESIKALDLLNPSPPFPGDKGERDAGGEHEPRQGRQRRLHGATDVETGYL